MYNLFPGIFKILTCEPGGQESLNKQIANDSLLVFSEVKKQCFPLARKSTLCPVS